MQSVRALLPAAELAYAKFNADRTAKARDPLATLESTDTLAFIRARNEITLS